MVLVSNSLVDSSYEWCCRQPAFGWSESTYLVVRNGDVIWLSSVLNCATSAHCSARVRALRLVPPWPLTHTHKHARPHTHTHTPKLTHAPHAVHQALPNTPDTPDTPGTVGAAHPKTKMGAVLLTSGFRSQTALCTHTARLSPYTP